MMLALCTAVTYFNHCFKFLLEKRSIEEIFFYLFKTTSIQVVIKGTSLFFVGILRVTFHLLDVRLSQYQNLTWLSTLSCTVFIKGSLRCFLINLTFFLPFLVAKSKANFAILLDFTAVTTFRHSTTPLTDSCSRAAYSPSIKQKMNKFISSSEWSNQWHMDFIDSFLWERSQYRPHLKLPYFLIPQFKSSWYLHW